MNCKCEQQLDHSQVTHTRFRWIKRDRRYEKYRRRKCHVCNGSFSTVEINRSEFNDYQKFKNFRHKVLKHGQGNFARI